MNSLDFIIIESHKETLKRLDTLLDTLKALDAAIKDMNDKLSIPSPYVTKVRHDN